MESSIKEVPIESWDHFLCQANLQSSNKGLKIDRMFRGQANVKWGLRPSFLRLADGLNLKDRQQLFNIESLILVRFSQDAPTRGLHIPPTVINDDRRNQIHLMNELQHYGGPTRVLDWTPSPLVGLYFAVRELPYDQAVLWVLNFEIYFERAKKLGRRLNDQSTKLEWYSESDLMFAELPMIQSPRSLAQQGAFTIAEDLLKPHEVLLSSKNYCADGESPILEKWIIGADLKKKFLNILHKCNVHAANLFPDRVGLSYYAQDLTFMCA